MAARGGLHVIVVQILPFARKINFDRLVAKRIVEVLFAEAELPTFAIAEHVQVAGVGDECAMVIPATGRRKCITYTIGFTKVAFEDFTNRGIETKFTITGGKSKMRT